MEFQIKINSNNEINYTSKISLFSWVQRDHAVSEQNQNSTYIMLILNPLKISPVIVPASSLDVH